MAPNTLTVRTETAQSLAPPPRRRGMLPLVAMALAAALAASAPPPKVRRVPEGRCPGCLKKKSDCRCKRVEIR